MAKNFVDAAIFLIREEPGLTAAEYAQRALDRGLVWSQARDPIISFCATVSAYVTRSGGTAITRRYQNGAYHYSPAGDHPEGQPTGALRWQAEPWTRAGEGDERYRPAGRSPDLDSTEGGRWSGVRQTLLRFSRPWPEGTAPLRRLITKAADDPTCSSTSPMEQYLLGVVAYELERYEEAVGLFQAALSGGIDGAYRPRAEWFQEICHLKASERANYR